MPCYWPYLMKEIVSTELCPRKLRRILHCSSLKFWDIILKVITVFWRCSLNNVDNRLFDDEEWFCEGWYDWQGTAALERKGQLKKQKIKAAKLSVDFSSYILGTATLQNVRKIPDFEETFFNAFKFLVFPFPRKISFIKTIETTVWNHHMSLALGRLYSPCS